MEFLLICIVIGLLIPGLLKFLTWLTLGVAAVTITILTIDRARVEISHPMQLETHSKSGYPSFNIQHDLDFNSYPFRKAVTGKPFVLTGGISTKYNTDEVEVNATGDENVSNIKFKSVENIAYVTSQCVQKISKFNVKRIIEISELTKINKMAECHTDNCKNTLIIRNFQANTLPKFTCVGAINDLPINVNCVISNTGTSNGKCMPTEVILRSSFFFGYDRQSDLEILYLNNNAH